MGLIQWLKNQLQKIKSSDNGPFTVEIAKLKEDKKNLNATIKIYTIENASLVSQIEELIDESNELLAELKDARKNYSIDEYKEWLDENIHPHNTYYNFGNGRKQVHTIFADSIKDEELIREFITEDLEFDASRYNTSDTLVLAFNRALSAKYPTRRYYDSDSNLYGTIEYWATAKQTIEKLRRGVKSYDCDDSMTLRYSCLYYLLQDRFPMDIWRLRGFIVDIWTGGGHALLAWVKEGPNDWIPIETTFLDTEQLDIWNKNYRIRNQMLYQIRYSFDNEHEYKRI